MTSLSALQGDAQMGAGPGDRPIPAVPGVVHRFVAARGARFHVAQAGAGDPVVLLHGLPQHWYAWRKVIPELAGEYQLFCVDLRGCGWSEATRRGYGMREQVRDILAVMDALGLKRVRLIGHENGGWLGFALCLSAPERFSGFLAVNTSHPWPGRARLVRNAWRFWYTAFWEYPGAGRLVLRHWPGFTRFLLRRWAGPSGQWDPAELEEFVQASSTRSGSRAIQQMLWQFVVRDIPALVLRSHRRSHLAVPTLILAGEKDPVSRPAPGKYLADHAGDLEIAIVPGWHLLAETAPRIVAAAAREHFGRC
ncbi:MAG TPA: alpha/beta hydrolase [Streptosporangiaceae bacterium]